ncbi:Scr1 family TA system antitoxin-like transcriptional regulator [Streptomyces sp. NPDC059631]|uniref:Scr1 family TA system antitoxin-like transcriptional regulator n=1 Tax=unclassified Streptomyces TaxID=2593676 RepID=UPI0036AE8262
MIWGFLFSGYGATGGVTHSEGSSRSDLAGRQGARRVVPDAGGDRIDRNSRGTVADRARAWIGRQRDPFLSLLRLIGQTKERPCPTARFGHLLGAKDLQNVAVGIVPFSERRTVWPMPTFTVFDDTRVHADTLDAASTLTQPSQVELNARAFERLAQGVARGAAARSLIADAPASLG